MPTSTVSWLRKVPLSAFIFIFPHISHFNRKFHVSTAHLTVTLLAVETAMLGSQWFMYGSLQGKTSFNFLSRFAKKPFSTVESFSLGEFQKSKLPVLQLRTWTPKFVVDQMLNRPIESRSKHQFENIRVHFDYIYKTI